MKTNFSPEQLRHQNISEADAILRKCVHCGLCTAVCPTYVLLGDERDSPRGRISLIKDMFEEGRAASQEVQFHVDRCLSCLSCMANCPSHVDYMHLVDLARKHIEVTRKRSMKERTIRFLLAALIPFPNRFRLVVRLASWLRPFKFLFQKIGLKEITAMLELAPSRLPARGKLGTRVAKPKYQRIKCVALMPGCAQQVLRPEINDATVRLLARQGVEVIVPKKSVCCGALVLHMGKEKEGITAAKYNVDAWYKQINDEQLDAIIINTSGCGTVIKDYPHVLRNEPGYARRAEEISKLTMDITEFLSLHGLDAAQKWSSITVAYHSACSLQHGQNISEEPRSLLQQAGFSLVEIPEGHICCGSAGTYNILQPELAGELRDRKVENIRSVGPDVIVSGNIGCISQIAQGIEIPIVHTIELLDWAYGGPCPEELQHLHEKITSVSSLYDAEQLT